MPPEAGGSRPVQQSHAPHAPPPPDPPPRPPPAAEPPAAARDSAAAARPAATAAGNPHARSAATTETGEADQHERDHGRDRRENERADEQPYRSTRDPRAREPSADVA